VIDDYGDVYGIFVAIYGNGYSYAELKDVVDMLRRELLLVEDVGKIDTYGERVEAVYVELKNCGKRMRWRMPGASRLARNS